MPEVNTATFALETAGPGELEARRRQIVSDLTTKFRGYNDPDVPIEMLQELAAITASLRRKTAGPPKATKARKASGPAATADDLAI